MDAGRITLERVRTPLTASDRLGAPKRLGRAEVVRGFTILACKGHGNDDIDNDQADQKHGQAAV
jgi:hypothetical protein